MPLLYWAGMDANEFKRFRHFAPKYVFNFMYTFADFLGERGEKVWLKSQDQLGAWQPTARVFLDSGAFSAFNSGVNLTLDDYMLFLETYEDQFYQYASLDDKSSQEQTYANYKEMRYNGFNPAPVWHAIGSPLELLEEYMADPAVPYICIGAIAKEKISDDFSYRRLNAVFKLVGKYRKPVHSFGRTEPELLVRYPFTSADSSTWYCVRHGAILEWNPVNRSLRQIRMRNARAMEKAFGPRAKVLLGNVPESYGVPHYYIATEHNCEQIYIEEQFLEEYWQRRNITWQYNDYDKSWKQGHVDPAVRARCLQRRKGRKTPVFGDTQYKIGTYVGDTINVRLRKTRKWERPTTREEGGDDSTGVVEGMDSTSFLDSFT